MSKRVLRKLHVDGVGYLWTRKHVHLKEFQYTPCIEILTVYQEGMKQCPLRLFFKEDDSIKAMVNPDDSHWAVGYPGDGIIWQTGDKNGCVNLNRPGVVAEIIRYGKKNGWRPEVMKKPFEVLNGFEWVEFVEFPAENKE